MRNVLTLPTEAVALRAAQALRIDANTLTPQPDSGPKTVAAIWHQKVGPCKTGVGQTVPLDSYMAEDLLRWSPHAIPGAGRLAVCDPSMRGEQPYWPDNAGQITHDADQIAASPVSGVGQNTGLMDPETARVGA